jgi:hypothetical protein
MVLETLRIDELDGLINEYQLQLKIEGKSVKTINIYTTALSSGEFAPPSIAITHLLI